MRGFSFQKRLLLGVILLVFTTTVILAMVGIHFGSEFLRIRFKNRMEFLAQYLALNSELGILLGDKTMLENLSHNLLSANDVAMVLIKDSRGNTLIKAGRDLHEFRGEVTAPVWLSEEKDGLSLGRRKTAKQRLGTVHVIYSTTGIQALLHKLRNIYLVAGTAIGLAGLFAFYLFSRSLLAPLKELVKAAAKVATGDLSVRVSGGSIPEIRQLATSFNNMLISLLESRKKLEDTYRQITQQKALAEVGRFALTVAHQIKNPLSIIRGALELLKKNEVDQDTKSTMVAYIEDEIIRLDRLIQDFLKFSRPQKPNFQDTDLNDLTRSLLERSRIEWQERDLTILDNISDRPYKFKADAELLSQAIQNILKNACEACHNSGSEVIVNTRSTEKKWILEIIDTGPGIPADIKEKIFTPFFTTKSQGTGLGLAFVEQAVKVHGGKIWITDGGKGFGTKVVVELSKQ